MNARGIVGLAKMLTVSCVAGICVGESSAWAVVIYEELWDTGDTNGAIPSTTSTTIVRDDSVGNPAASIALRRILSDPILDIGVTTESPAFPNNLTGIPAAIASFDVLYDVGAFAETWLRLRYQDETYNGWYKVLATTFPSGWQTHSTTFDPAWTDVEAAANGWIDETGGTVSWQQLMSDIYHPEIRFVLGDQNSAIVHADNVVLEVVPEPASLVLLASAAIPLLARWRCRRC